MSNTSRLILAPVLLASLLWLMPATTGAQTVYAAVWGHPKHVVGSSTLYSGLYRSSDLGRTWVHLGPENLKAFSMDAVDRGRILYIAAGNGVHRSTDSGRTWKIVTDWRITEVLDVAVDRRRPERLYAATAFGLWMSQDAGETWTNPPGPLQSPYILSVVAEGDSVRAIAHVSRDDDQRISPEVWVSTDRARSWRVLGVVSEMERELIDSIPVMDRVELDGAERLAATWGGGIYRRQQRSRWIQSGLEERQVWRVKVRE